MPEASTNDELTLSQLAAELGVSRRTISDYCSKTKRHVSRRLRVIRYGHKTVKVRRSDWMKFKEACSQ